MKHYAKKRTLIRAVRWRGEMTPEVRELIRERAPNVEYADPLNLGNGWEARSGDWIYSASGEDLAVLSDEVFRKIYEEVDDRVIATELNQAIDHMISSNQQLPADDLLAKARSMCAELSTGDLRIAIEVHRTSCHLDNCPVLAAMEDHARTREASP